jgi:hypothetical protein
MREISFYDLEFKKERVLCTSDIGAPVHRLVPIGMPKLGADITNIAFYLYREEPDPKGGQNKITGPWGSGSIVGRQVPGVQIFHYYGVTNWHVAVRDGASIIRINTADEKTRILKYQPEDWQFLRNHDDLAVVDLTDDLREKDEINFSSEQGFITEQAIRVLEIGAGDDVFMVGLFVEAHGGERNIPSVRFGNISLMANDKALVEQPNGMKRPSYLTDMRSKGGFSGSPVILYRIPEADLYPIPNSGAPLRLKPNPKFVGLLGIHCAQFWEPTEVQKKPPSASEQLGDPIKDGDKLYIPGAMNIVVPAWRISELLDLEVFEMARKKREPAMREAAAKRARAETVDSPANDENPNAREDFMRLQVAAARKQQRDD